MDLNDVAGRRIRVMRKALGLTQEELGRKVNVTYQQIQKYEAGKNNLSVNMLQKISAALDTSVPEILGHMLDAQEPETKEDIVQNLYFLSKLDRMDSPKIREAILVLIESVVESKAHEPQEDFVKKS